MSTAEQLHVPLWFDRRDLRRLEEIVETLKQNGTETEHISLFESAAESVRRNEALTVHCTTREEVEAMADGFTRFGVGRPSIG